MIVLFDGDEPVLLLSHVTVGGDGNLVSGWVENGGWDVNERDADQLARLSGLERMEVPDHIDNHYDEVMRMAQEVKRGGQWPDT